MKDSAIARTAIYQWNKMNTAVRMLVHKTTVSVWLYSIPLWLMTLCKLCYLVSIVP